MKKPIFDKCLEPKGAKKYLIKTQEPFKIARNKRLRDLLSFFKTYRFPHRKQKLLSGASMNKNG